MVDPPQRVIDRVIQLLGTYEPPDFAEVPTPDGALFLSAVDHRTGYRGGHLVEGSGPQEGSALLWALGLRAEEGSPGTLSAENLVEVTGEAVAELFRIEGETVAGPAERAELWRDLASGLLERYRGEASALIEASGARLGGPDGALARLGEFEAFCDPLRKKSFLACKIWERRGWLRVSDPESWQVCSDNVLMRLALRSGLVEPGTVEEVRRATLEAWRRVADQAGVSPPVLDDLLWERGRDDADLVGVEAGDLREPPRREGVLFY